MSPLTCSQPLGPLSPVDHPALDMGMLLVLHKQDVRYFVTEQVSDSMTRVQLDGDTTKSHCLKRWSSQEVSTSCSEAALSSQAYVRRTSVQHVTVHHFMLGWDDSNTLIGNG